MDNLTGINGRKLYVVKLAHEVYILLRQRILSHEYPAGFRFDLPALEHQLGVSRTPLKEALNRLEADGLVEIRPRRGTFVIHIDPRDIAETFDVRRALELHAAEVAVREASDAEIADLKAIAAEMRRLLETGDYHSIVHQYIGLDHEFHNQFVRLSRNNRLMQIYQRIDVHVQIARIRQKFTRSDSMHTESEHDTILQALERRDAAALAKALREHIELSKARVLHLLDVHA